MHDGSPARTARPALDRVDLSATLARKPYEKRLIRLQRKLQRIQQAYLCSHHAAVIVFEGWDAAGKGGAIRRIAMALDPRSFKVWPISAPRRYYLERHFLARFMERLPPNGAISAFDRSWYGRVLVERVEQLTPPARWRAAYREINDFERMLSDDGTRVVKLFFHISTEEQLRRFEGRLRDPMKRWKLTYDDFRNHRRRSDYEDAVNEMIGRTHTRHAPWTLISGEDKRHARVAALEAIVHQLGRGVDLAPPPPDERTLEAVRETFGLSDAEIAALLDGDA